MPQGRAYADVIGNFRRGQANAHARGGDYEGAARVAGDPALSQTYMGMADRQRQREERDEARAYGRDYAGALHRGDYDAAGAAAARYGDPEGVSGARTAQSQASEQERVEAWRALQGYVTRLESLEGNPDAQAEWSAMLEEAIAGSAESPELQAQIQRFPRDWNVARARVPGIVRTWMERLLTPQQVANLQNQRETREYNQRRSLTPQEAAAAGLRPGTVAQTDGTGQIYVVQQPLAPRTGSGASGYRPVTPEEAAAYDLPNEGRGWAMGANGRPVRVNGASASGGTWPAEQRARVAIMYEPALEASRLIDGMEEGGYRPHHDWGAAALEAVPWDGGTVARWAGGVDMNEDQRGDYGRYNSASSTFESSMLPILSGAAVTPSEAQRIIRSALPQVGDSEQVLEEKSRRRQQMLNGAAQIGSRALPYPEAGVPDWAQGGAGDGYDPDDPTTWTPEQRRQWLEDNPE